MPSPLLPRRVSIVDDIATRDHDDGLVALNLKTGYCWELNAVASHVWKLLTAGQSPAAIVENIAADYDVEVDRAQQDVLELLAQLRNQGFIETVD